MKFLDDVPAITAILATLSPGTRVAIYGAGRSGRIVADLIRTHRPDLDLRFFVDSFKSGHVGGLPVYDGETFQSHLNEIQTILIVSSSWYEIEAYLDQRGISNYLTVKRGPGFKGWGLVTEAVPPWEDGLDELSFLQDQEDLKRNFHWSGSHAISDNLDDVRWRNWGIAFAVRYALARCNSPVFVECGVCDGMTAFFALREAKRKVSQDTWSRFQMHLYDSWQAMDEGHLQGSEKHLAGEYAGLTMEGVRKNLAEFSANLVLHPGFIPETLGEPPAPPQSISYLHIDLNSAQPTVDALTFFLPRMQPGSIIVFDDYGADNYRETRLAVNEVLRTETGQLLPLPTVGAYYFV